VCRLLGWCPSIDIWGTSRSFTLGATVVVSAVARIKRVCGGVWARSHVWLGGRARCVMLTFAQVQWLLRFFVVKAAAQARNCSRQ